MLLEGPWEENKLERWGTNLTILGSAIIGIGAILIAMALIWKPRPPKRKHTIPTRWEKEDSIHAESEVPDTIAESAS